MTLVTVNNIAHQFSKIVTLKEILEQLKVSQSGIAVAINKNIISKTAWANTQVNNKDDILIIKATQGG